MPPSRRAGPLSSSQEQAWRGLLLLHAQLTSAVTEALSHAAELTLREYEVLAEVAGGRRGRLRMGELAGRVTLTASGLSRLVERLYRRDLLTRTASEQDGRALVLELTAHGRDLVHTARRAHAAGVREALLERLSAPEVDQLAALAGRLTAQQ